MKPHETSDVHRNEDMVTCYYVADYTQCKLAVERIAKNFGYQLQGSNDNYGELLLKSGPLDIIVRIYSYNPRETGIDFFITKNSFFAPSPVKHVAMWTSELKKSLQFKGKGLHKNG